ncbi:GNAT family N-acetyltransferase [Paenibacillus alba]|uniref:GNAT family N-acetyltransferase n=1 Tax=Paenibacillus alba TaxID=1197127 RepID=A0ABU6FY32_9BACL|nr:GNAT family N-acetyltransferase [Paenibacillus alba]MEC0226255.1 GNAT family N-acetyltransferase [Paenibacillus alba]NQX66923.1 GNAT family N-acetyltransferase [Paenibacillus alba]
MYYRKANMNDINQLVHLRKKQLVDEGIEPNQDIDSELNSFFHNKMSDGSLIEWIVEDNEETIATGAIIFYDFPPSFTNKSGKMGYITNMYTKENYRGQRIATTLLTKLVDEARIAGVSKIWLGASTLGRPVYKKFGFIEADYWMELNL